MSRFCTTRRLFVALLVAASAVAAPTVASTAPPIVPLAHCSPVANAPVAGVKSYGGVYCPGGSSHAIGFTLRLLKCNTIYTNSCTEVDSKGFNFPDGTIGSYTLGYGNPVACISGLYYRSRSTISVTGATATSGPYIMC